ncbi:MAG: hypothetical protein LUE98_20480 [Tannerellaceae bacterium]|nr:hypothetical protein [Tannerellaceae bacterium]
MWFPVFSEENKQKILGFILSQKAKGKLLKIDNEEKPFYSNYGLTTYLFLQAVPEEYIKKHTEINKIFQESSRRFGDKKPKDYLFSSRFKMMGVSSPVKSEAYAYMNDEQWISSFLKYKENTVSHDGKGGREQHARCLETEVKKRPQDFVNLFYRMVNHPDVHEEYIVHILYGFAECDLSKENLLEIFDKAIDYNNIFSADALICYPRCYNNLFAKGIVGQKTLDHACELLLSAFPPYSRINKKDRDLYGIGINSISGSSLMSLLKLNLNEHGEIVLSTIEKAIQNTTEDVLSIILVHIRYLYKVNPERALTVFQSVTENASDELFIYSIHSIQCYAYYFFSHLNSYFERAVNIQDENFRKQLTAVFYYEWLRGTEGAEIYLWNLVKEDTVFISRLIECAVYSLFEEEKSDYAKAMLILTKYIDSREKEICEEYETCFHSKENKWIPFDLLYPFLLKYVKSPCFNPHRCIIHDYLIHYASAYPEECFNLFKELKVIIPDKSKDYSPKIRQKQIRLVLGFYQRFSGEKDSEKLKYINNVLDQLFENVDYFSELDIALEEKSTSGHGE